MLLRLPIQISYPANIYLFKVNNRNDKKRCEIYSKFKLKIENDVINVVLVSLLLTLNIIHTFFGIYIVDFEHIALFAG